MMRILVASLLLVPSVAAADLHEQRKGGTPIGASVGGGGMTINNDTVGCPDCEYQPLALEVDAHFGSMFSARQAVMCEIQLNVKSVDDNELFVERLGTGAFLLTTQYWLTQPIWVKGGFGIATTTVFKEEGNIRQHGPGGMGLALMGGAGYEVLAQPEFAIDVQARLITGLGEGITAASLGVGINWY